jgi:hypothetical protein
MAATDWTFSPDFLSNSPSIQDGIPAEKEARYRYDAFRYIEELQKSLKLPQLVMNTACALMHRFYAYQSFKDFPWHSMSLACFFLACKVEEKVLLIRTVLKWGVCIRKKMLNQKYAGLDESSEEFFELKEELLAHEQLLLQTIGFDLSIKHPAACMLNHMRILTQRKLLPAGHKTFANVVWSWCHASYGADFCLKWQPDVIACAFIFGAARVLEVEIQHTPEQPWWNVCLPARQHVSETVLIEILNALHGYCLRHHEPRPDAPGAAVVQPANPTANANAPPPTAAPRSDATASAQTTTSPPRQAAEKEEEADLRVNVESRKPNSVLHAELSVADSLFAPKRIKIGDDVV